MGSGAGVGSGSLCTGAHRQSVSAIVLVLLSLSLLVSLSSSSALLVRRSTAAGHEVACGCSRLVVPTAERLLPRIFCSLSFGVRSSIWVAMEGGLLHYDQKNDGGQLRRRRTVAAAWTLL